MKNTQLKKALDKYQFTDALDLIKNDDELSSIFKDRDREYTIIAALSNKYGNVTNGGVNMHDIILITNALENVDLWPTFNIE